MREVFQNFLRFRQALGLAARRGYRELDLDARQYGVLKALHDLGPSSAVDLCRATLSDPAAINRAVVALVKRGLVTQVQDPKDRRRSRLTLTPKEGRGLARKVVRHSESLARKAFQPFSAAELQRFNRDLERLIKHLGGGLEP